MNRKLFNGLLLLTVATGGIGTFTSCKDTEQDFQNVVLKDQEQLKTELKAEIDAIRKLTDPEFLNNLNNQIIDQVKNGNFEDAKFYLKLMSEIQAANDRIDDLSDAYKAADDALKTQIMSDVATQLETLKTTLLSQMATDLASLKGDLETYVNDQIQKALDGIESVDLQPLWEAVNKATDDAKEALDKANAADATANEALEQALFNAGSIERLEVNISTLQSELATLTGEVDTVKENITTMQGKLEGMSTDIQTLQTKYSNLNTALEGVKDDLSALTTTVGNLSTSLDNFKSDMDEYMHNVDTVLNQYREEIENLNSAINNLYSDIMQKFARLVTGIKLNQVHNSIFGTFNFPVGVGSKIVTNYFGLSTHDAVFPPNPDMQEGLSIEYSNHSATEGLLQQLKDIDAPFQQVMSANVVQLDKLADIYLTVDPGNRNFEGLTLSMVNSQDEAVPVLDELELKKTSKVLTMGTSRSADDNGFYVAEAKPRTSFTAEELEGIRYDLEPGLKSAFKDAIKDHTKADFIELAKLLYKQLAKDVPAYAVKCEWDDTDIDENGTEIPVKKSVRSDYEMAVLTFRPLSYSSGFGVGSDITLPTPTVGYIKERINDAFARLKNKLQLGLTGVSVDNISIDLSMVKINIDAMTIVVDLSGCPVYSTTDPDRVIGYLGDEAKITLTYTPGTDGEIGTGDLASLATAIQDAIEDMLSGAGDDSLTAQIERQLKDQIQSICDDINEQLYNVQAKINNTIDDIHKRIFEELGGKYGRIAEHLLDLYNRLADKFNDVIANPNAYLQVMMAYMGNDNMIHRVSTTAADATPLKAGNNMEIFATSYNAEIIVPSFKKYVAVVDAFETANPSNHNLAYAKEANGADYLNVVRPGDQQRFYLDGSKLHEGYTYKVVYSSLDYHGFTSTQVYYVKVTK